MVGGSGVAKDKPKSVDAAPPQSSVVANPAPPNAAAPSAAAVAAPATQHVAVALAATPKTAQALRDGKPIALPASLDVEDGKPIAIELRAPGYETVNLESDGSQPSKLVELKPLRSSGPAKPTVKSAKGAGDVVDPWAR